MSKVHVEINASAGFATLEEARAAAQAIQNLLDSGEFMQGVVKVSPKGWSSDGSVKLSNVSLYDYVVDKATLRPRH